MQPHQAAFVDLLLEYEALRFGSFTLKSGRDSPYFVNAGQLRTGDAIARLGHAYAATILGSGVECDLVFGPSYKGVPLAVTTAMALAAEGLDTPFAFDRKEAKDHGEGGVFVGTEPAPEMNVVVVDDVITSGRSIREAVTLLRSAADVAVSAVVVAVDRQERGKTERTTLAELREELRAPILPIVKIRDVAAHLSAREVLSASQHEAMLAYWAQYGGKD